MTPAAPEGESTPVLDLLGRSEQDLPSTEDVLAACLPLLRQVAEVHGKGLVAPLEGIGELRVTSGRIWFENAKARPVRRALAAVEAAGHKALQGPVEVVAHYRRTDEDGASSFEDLRIGTRGTRPERPVYLPGFVSWEHELGHHDPVTDVFVLGLLLASLSAGLDLTGEEDLRQFVLHREDLRRLNPGLHPVAALVIARMTELDRHRRQQDLAEAIAALERRREQDALQAFDLSKFRGFVASTASNRRDAILGHLQSRLHDRSRRNRLLYFRSTGSTLNLTAGSVPLVLDVKNIDPSSLVTWAGGGFVEQVVAQKPVVLSKWLRFEDYPYITPALDRARLDAARDAAEYGFSQLRLVACFLHWHDLKNAPEERISSPLLLLPVRLSKKKGVRDAYTLEATSELAEVNPVLRHHLKQLYGLALPELIDLSEPKSLDDLHRALVEQITATEPGVCLEKLERPKIDLVQAIARRRLELHQRRARLTGRGVRTLHGLSYAYGRDRRAPLGVQLFANVVFPSAAPQRELLEDPKPRVFRLGPAVKEVAKEQYQLRDASEPSSPYRWTFDLCSVTLANFNYRKMSLVGDYAALLREAEAGESPIFQALFPREARPLAKAPEPLPLAERHAVVDGDPTQTDAIALARSGACFVIQGPPGTGKSQTIANLIADHLARGKRVLFVCEKRAAIDVVHHRLQQQGLGRLCCVIHDSQEDKKGFVAALKETYESWIQGAPDPEIERARQAALDAARAEGERLEQFSAEMTAPAAGADARLVDLMRRCVELGPPPSLPEDALALLPDHRVYSEGAATLQRIRDDLRRIGANPVLGRSPMRLVRGQVLSGPQALEQLRGALRRIRERVQAVAQGPDERAAALAATCERAALARQILPLSRARLLPLLDAASELYRRVRTGVLDLKRRLEALSSAEQEARGWRSPLLPDEAEVALAQARRHERSLLRFFFPSFWRLRRLLRERFDFSLWAVRPAFSRVLERLLARYGAQRQVEERRRQLAEESGVEDVAPLFEVAERLQRQELSPPQRRLLEALQVRAGDAAPLEALSSFAGAAEEIEGVLAGWKHLSARQLVAELDQLDAGFSRLPDALPILNLVDSLPASLGAAIRLLPLGGDELEAAICHRAVRSSAGVRRGDVDGAALESAHDALVRAHGALRRANAAAIVERTRARFLENVKISAAPAAGLEADQKSFKRTYAAGRRELEREFAKVMRFRPIRDLVSGAPGAVVRDLKPVWLMSPLSVADALPLAAEFDVVVVDEASQIPLEDSIPALERGRQVIVVGDDKQLPPTAFFASRAEEEDEAVEAEGIALEADSLLDHAARSMPSTMLGWHYRSRDEALISFCNQAFYEGRLLTVPSVRRVRALPEIRAGGAGAADAGAQALLERSVSFHRTAGAVYSQRCNALEAEYVAALVRSLLARETGLSIGVVAFSEAQQAEIERAIRALAGDDAAFRARYEAELERTDEGQFNGLFVKNLENVQGDERDVMILSVCYGPDAAGKTSMNFGPINQRGGERRLNVLFSRAKKHMAVVSSMDWQDITNDYNDGAACLKAYLRYAAAMSRGDEPEASAVLDGLARAGGRPAAPAEADPVAAQLARVFRDKGWVVDLDVGASRFRCNVAIRAAGETQYRLGILIDTQAHYANPDLDDRYRLKPAILRTFGWNVRWVLTRDWLLDREAVIARIESALA